MLEEAAPLFRAGAQRGIDQPLPDDGIALPERRGDLQDIAQADPTAVDQVVRLAIAEDPPRDRYFAEIER